jgi:hypothetical protein
MNADIIQIEELVHVDDPFAVLDEVKIITRMIFQEYGFSPMDGIFKDILRLFSGDYPGYRKCNTKYHDLKHTTDTLLAMAGLIHGASICGHSLSERNINLGLACALFHDTGYIQKSDDLSGTGAKYTLVHISRSIEFMQSYLSENMYFREEDLSNAKDILRCTGLNTRLEDIHFRTGQIEMMGKILGTADLMGQMADRKYLEKLLFLFQEFREGGVGGFETELDLLNDTVQFNKMTKERFAGELGRANRFMRFHFKKRWNLDRDLYAEAIDRKIEYLKVVLKEHRVDYRVYLRRGRQY